MLYFYIAQDEVQRRRGLGTDRSNQVGFAAKGHDPTAALNTSL
jgi:hypothetical protein